MLRSIILTLVVAAWAVATDSTKLPADDAVEQAIAGLHDPDAQVATRAAYALGQMGSDAAPAIPALVDALNDDRPQSEFFVPIMFDVGDAAGEALAAIGPPAVDPVMKLLSHDDVEMQQTAIHILTRMTTQAAAAEPALRQLAESSDDDYVRDAARAAVPYISTRPPEELVEYVRGFLGHKDAEARQWAVETLGTYGEAARPAVPQLIEALSDESLAWKSMADFAWQEPLRIDVADALSAIGPAAKAALPKLREMMHQDEDACVQVAAAFAVSQIDTKDVASVDFLVDAAGDRIDGCPARAVGHLRSLPDRAQAAVGVVRKLAEDSEPGIRIEALLTLAALAGPDAVPTLSAALDDKESSVRSAAAKGLGSLGAAARPAVDGLIRAMLHWEDALYDRPAMKALVAIGEPREKIVSALRKAMHGLFISREELHEVVAALQSLEAQEAATIELNQLANEADDENVRRWAAAELSILKNLPTQANPTSSTEPNP